MAAVDACDGRALVKPHPEGGQISLQWLPQCGVVVRVRDVENEALAGAEEIEDEHGRQLRGRQLRRAGEEAAREHLESQMARRLGEIETLQEGFGVDVIEAAIDVGQR